MSTPPFTPVGHAQPLPVDPDKTLVHQDGWEGLIDFRNKKEEKKSYNYPLSDTLIEFDPFYSPIHKKPPQSLRKPVVNLPAPQQGISDKILQDEKRRSLLPIHLRPTASTAPPAVHKTLPVVSASPDEGKNPFLTTPVKPSVPLPSTNLSYVTPPRQSVYNRAPFRSMASPESPLAIKRNKELIRAGDVAREAMRGERSMIGVSKYLLITGVDKEMTSEELSARIKKHVRYEGLVFKYQPVYGFIIVITRTSNDTQRLIDCISHNMIQLRRTKEASHMVPSGLSLPAHMEDSDNEDGKETRDEKLSWYRLDCKTVYDIVGEPVVGYLEYAEGSIKITVHGEITQNVEQSLMQALKAAGTLNDFRFDGKEAYIAKLENTTDTQSVLKTFQGSEFGGLEVSVELYLEGQNEPHPYTSPKQGHQGPFGKNTLGLYTPPQQRHGALLPSLLPETPSRKRSDICTPSRPSIAERSIYSTPGELCKEDLIDAIREERKRWESYERALFTTPRHTDSIDIFGDTPTTPSRGLATGSSASPISKLVSFNSLKSPANTRSDDWRGPPPPTKGQDSVRYKQEVPHAYRFSLEKLQRGRSSGSARPSSNTDPSCFRSGLQDDSDDQGNKLSRDQLIEAIHEVVPGGVTFAYLRFDWEFQCNVAYGFVNFRSLRELELFARHRLGQKWNLFMSEKVLQMSYATIQGHEALVAHFRNSTVMQAAKEWRPIILNADGEEESFPPPNKVRYNKEPQGFAQQDTKVYDWGRVDGHVL